MIPELGRTLERAGVHVWTLSFSTEKGAPLLRGSRLDAALAEIATLAGELSLQLEVAGAPQVRRVLRTLSLPADRLAVAPADGLGLLHVAADGALWPSPSLRIKVGSARQQDVVDAFRDAPALGALRDPHRLGGKCRFCEYVAECGGSRARAWSFTGDFLAPDPACGYQPAAAELSGRAASGRPRSRADSQGRPAGLTPARANGAGPRSPAAPAPPEPVAGSASPEP
jgi:MoaA/NifB/PqqE/SkfB family radical SAM enzyme